MKEKITDFDPAVYLDSEETIAEYLTVTLEENDPDLLLAALSNVARARGMTQIAKESGLGRESLYKALAPGAKPRFETIMKVLHLNREYGDRYSELIGQFQGQVNAAYIDPDYIAIADVEKVYSSEGRRLGGEDEVSGNGRWEDIISMSEKK